MNGSKPRDDPQPRPALINGAKHGAFVFSFRHEVLAESPGGSGKKNLIIAFRESVTRERCI